VASGSLYFSLDTAMQERLQKIIAAAGVASRRAAEEMIQRGEVSVNGKAVTELGTKADPERDHIKVRGKLINPQLASREKKYLLVNKPRGYLSSVADPKQRPLVMDLVPAQARRGLHPVGRLDFNTEGLIILTNDGELTKLLTEGGKVPKVYHVKVKGSPSEEQLKRLRRGVKLGETRTAPAEIMLLEHTRKAGNDWYEIVLRQGKNQQIRRMFDSTGHSVTKLRRIQIGHITDKGLAPGQYRELKASGVAKFFQNETKPPVQPRRKKINRKDAKRANAAKGRRGDEEKE
jgi:23S rRNA pseudouridine2605 synthase